MFGRLVVWVLPHARLPEGMVTAYETCPRACAHRCHNRKYCFGGNLLCNLLRNLLRLRFGCAEGLRPKNLLSVICYTICYPLANQTICAEAATNSWPPKTDYSHFGQSWLNFLAVAVLLPDQLTQKNGRSADSGQLGSMLVALQKIYTLLINVSTL